MALKPSLPTEQLQPATSIVGALVHIVQCRNPEAAEELREYDSRFAPFPDVEAAVEALAAQLGAALLTEATAIEIWTGTSSKALTARRLMAAMASQPVDFAAAIVLNGDAGFNFHVTLTGNAVLSNPLNFASGDSGRIRVTQDATGGRTLTFGNKWLFPGGDPTLSTGANAIDVIGYFVHADGTIEASCIKALA